MAGAERTIAATQRGIELLRDSEIDKSTAFTERERQALGLIGLLPSGVDSEATQVQRVMLQLAQKPTDLERYIYMIGLPPRGTECVGRCSSSRNHARISMRRRGIFWRRSRI
jgi:hypothetical protein